MIFIIFSTTITILTLLYLITDYIYFLKYNILLSSKLIYKNKNNFLSFNKLSDIYTCVFLLAFPILNIFISCLLILMFIINIYYFKKNK